MKNSSFLIPAILFISHQVLQYGFKWSVPFIDNYLDPFCFGALAMHGYLFERIWLYDYHKISLLSYLIIFLFLSLTSEVLFPLLSNRFVADWRDVVAIFLGILFFYITHGNQKRSMRYSFKTNSSKQLIE